MAKKKAMTKREAEKLMRDLDIWGEEWDEDKDLEAVRVKSKPITQIDVEPTEPPDPVGEVQRPRITRVYEERKDFVAEDYSPTRSLVPADHIEYDVTPEPLLDDKQLKKAFRPPKHDPVFKQKWNLFIHNVTARDNFNRAHLEQLSVLCDLFVEYEILVKSLQTTGYTYIVNTVMGAIPKPYPEVAQLNRTRSEIRNYSKMLGLLLVKDKMEREPPEDEWE